MGAKCPNINSNEWQALVERVGEDYAWGLYTLYDDIPLIAESVEGELIKLGLRNQQGEDLLKTKDLSEKLNKRYLNLTFTAEKIGNRFSHTVTEDYIPSREEIEAIIESIDNGTPNMSEELAMEQSILDSDMETEEPVLDSAIFDPNTKQINTYLDQLETTNTTLPFDSNMSAAYKSYETSVGSIVDARNALAQVLSPETKTHIDENVADLVGQVFYTAVPERALNSFIDNYDLRASFVNENNEPLGHSELVSEFLKYTPTTQVSAVRKRQLDLLNSVTEYLNQVSNTQSVIEDTLATIQEYKQSVPIVEETLSVKDVQEIEVEEFKGFWTREQVASETNKIFLFGDNTKDRTITKYIPSKTQAVIRGLPNAIGIDTKKGRGWSPSDFFTNADFDIFKEQVDAAIQKAKNSGKTIVIPADGIGTGKAMLKEKAPKLFDYLQQELNKLKKSQDQSAELLSDNEIINSEAFQKFNEENQFTTLEQNLDYYKRCKL